MELVFLFAFGFLLFGLIGSGCKPSFKDFKKSLEKAKTEDLKTAKRLIKNELEKRKSNNV